MSSSDFSAFALFTAGLALFTPTVTAALSSVPGGSDPTGPAIYEPNLNTVVPAGTPYSVTWKTGTDGCGDKVDLVLLMGPSAAEMSAISYIVQGLDNNGTYAWTPAKTLAPSASNYGIELVCVSTQAYQYTTRFGISNADYTGNSTSSSTTSKGNSTTTATTSSAKSSGTGSSGYTNTTTTGTATKSSSAAAVASTVTSTASVTASTGTATGSSTASASSSTSTSAAVDVKASVGGLLAAFAVAAFAL